MVNLKLICERNASTFDPVFIRVDDISQMQCDLKNLVREIEKGELVQVVHAYVVNCGNPICGKCSNCGADVNFKWPRCSNCGAKMDLEESKCD